MTKPRWVFGRILPVLSLLAGGAVSVLAAGTSASARPSSPPTAAAHGNAFTLDHLLTMRSISDLSWSSDGRRLAFVVSEPDTAENSNNQDVWVLDLAAGGEALRLTRHPKPDTSPSFSPSGDTLAFVANRVTGDEQKAGIYLMSLHGGDPWPLGTYPESVGEVRWSPDGRWLAWVMPDTLEKSVREWRKKKWDQAIEDERLQFSHVWVTELATGKRRRLTSEPIFLWNLRWSPDSKRLAFITSPSGKPDDSNLQDIGVVPVEGGSIRELGVIGTSFEWSPDSRWIALATASDRKVFVQPNDLWVVPADGGAARNLTVRFDGDVDTPCWSRGSDTLFFHAPQGVTSRVAAIPLHGGGVSLFNDRAAEAGTPVAARDGRIAWVQSQPEHPSEVWIAERPTAAGRAVTSINAAVAKLALGATRTVHWTSSDGVKIEGVLLRPPGAAERGPLKTLVLLHGGPYGARFGLGFQAAQQYFAAAGYQVFMPNFRSSSGYGADFLVRQRSDWGGQDWRDVMSGVDSLVASGLADGARLGVYGGSYGGYLSAWAITQTHRFDAASVSAGAVDLAAHYGQSDIHQYRAFDFGGPPWVTPENWRRASPITYIARARTPTLILVGESDARVPYPQSQELYTALHTLGVPVEFVHYPREGHGLREPRHRADQYTRMLAWFDRWVK